MVERKPQDTAALLLVTIVGVFVIGSLAALIIAAFNGGTGGDDVWAGLFSLMTAILGAVGGWVAGQASMKRNGNGQGAPPSEG